ncbi:MAG: ABC transporter permease [Candidatus Aenigmatarchaeota archaeon]
MAKEKIKAPLKVGRKFYGYLKKDLMLFYNRKKYLYLFILFPILIAGLFLFMFSPSSAQMDVGVCNFDQNEQAEKVISNLEGFRPVILEDEDCVKNLKGQVKSGEVALGIEIGPDFSENITNLKQSSLTIYYDNTDIAFSNLVSLEIDSSLQPYKRTIINNLNNELKTRVSVARQSIDVASEFTGGSETLNTKIEAVDEDLESIEELNTDFLINPIETEKEGVYETAELKYISLTFLYPIIALFLILMLASTSIIYDKKIGFVTKVKTSTTVLTYILAKMAFFFILSAIIFALLLSIFVLAGGSFSLNALEILKLILSISVTNSLVGLLIGDIADNEGVAILVSLFVSFPLMLLSGLFFPLQTMPSFVQFIIKALPLHYQIGAAKSVLLFGQSLKWSSFYADVPLFFLAYYTIRKNV